MHINPYNKMICIILIYFLLCIVASGKKNDAQEIDPRDIFLAFYTCNSTNAISIECVIQDIDCIHTTYKEINTNKNDTTVFIHGYQGNKESLPVQYMVSAYCSRNVSVIALLDWSRLAQGDFLTVTDRIPAIAKMAAIAFDTLTNNEYETRTWHLIGHSMGAHVAGCIGMYSDFRFLHITGLDPSSVVFLINTPDTCRINPNVAHFTDILYTDAGGSGTIKELGKLNIYVNTGTAPQPGCCSSPDVHGCGHIKAVQWYADAVRNESKYRATECANCFAFMRYGYCKGNNRIYLGPHVDTNTNGTYCLLIT